MKNTLNDAQSRVVDNDTKCNWMSKEMSKNNFIYGTYYLPTDASNYLMGKVKVITYSSLTHHDAYTMN